MIALHSNFEHRDKQTRCDMAGSIRYLARTGLAATDTGLNVAHLQDALGGTFDMIAAIAGEIEGLLMQLEDRDQGEAVQALREWKALRAAHKTKLDADSAFEATQECQDIEGAMEALGLRISDMPLGSLADAAAILEWCKLDTAGGCYCPATDKARDNVMEFLQRALRA